MRCAACRRENPSDASFCNGCGQPLVGDHGAPAAERRPLTVMFCDVVDSVRLSSGLDAEDWRSVVVRYNAACRHVVNRHHGFVVQYLGDGVLAYFGFPSATEHDAANAVQAGLDLLERTRELAERVRDEFGVELRIRVGIHSGLVVVGDTGDGVRAETQAIGDTLNIAARLEGTAPPDGIAIGPTTRAMVEGLFDTESLGPISLKGLEEPLEVSVVRGRTSVRHRLDAAGSAGLSPFVGREAPLQRMLDAWRYAATGTSSALIVEGEPGVGKSRLLREVRERVAAAGGTSLLGRAALEHRQRPFSVWIDLLGREVGPDTDSAERHLRSVGLDDDAARTLASLLGYRAIDEPATLAAERRRRTIEAIVAYVERRRGTAGVLLGLEDVHWADASSLEVLAALTDVAAPAGVAVVATTRPESVGLPEGIHRIRLEPLGDTDAGRLVAALLGSGPEVDEVVRLVARGSGVPLFLEELARARAAAATGPVVVPPTLHASLTARLDRLGDARELAQTLSVIGGAVPLGLLGRIAEIDGGAVIDRASVLVDHGLAEWNVAMEGTSIELRHSLVAEAAYDSLLRDRRRELHGRVAEALEHQRHGHFPAGVAEHFERAARDRDALRHWCLALESTTQAHALEEAASIRDRALACLGRLGDDAGAREEMRLRLTEFVFLDRREGFTGASQREVMDRLVTLADEPSVDDMSRLEMQLRVTTHLAARSEVVAANRWADMALALADRLEAPIFTVFVGAPVATARLLHGRYREARMICERALAPVVDDSSEGLLAVSGVPEAVVMSRSILGHALLASGWVSAGRDELDAAVSESRLMNPSDPHSVGWTLYFRAMGALMEDDLAGCRADADEIASIGDSFGFAELSAVGRMFDALVEMRIGDPAAAVARYDTQLATVPHFRPFAHMDVLRIDGQARAGDLEGALALATRHRARQEIAEELLCLEEYDALLGVLHHRTGGSVDLARTHFARAEAVADSVAAPLHRLRCALRAAPVLRDGGDVESASQALTDALAAMPVAEGSRVEQARALLMEMTVSPGLGAGGGEQP